MPLTTAQTRLSEKKLSPCNKAKGKTNKNKLVEKTGMPNVLKNPCNDKDIVVDYPTPSMGWGHGGRPWSTESRATPQGLDQRS